MKVLVVGSGAREHALVRALAADDSVQAVVAAPGNPGIEAIGAGAPTAGAGPGPAAGTPTGSAPVTVRALDLADLAAIAGLAVQERTDLVVIGPEGPLVAGAADAVRARGVTCFGPTADAARIEGSKAFAKEVMAAAGVPTAMAHVCEKPREVAAALDAFGPPYVVKADGLAAGKGVVVTGDRAAALEHAAASGRVLVEEYLDGPEVSLFALTDGRTVLPLLPAQDAKRLGDGDTGPNTGGMGAYAPLTWAPPGLVDEAMARVLQPTVDQLRAQGTPFAGLLYAGLALTARGLRVVEFNARFGDPETQVVLALLRTPLAGLLHAAATGRLAECEPPAWHPGAAVTVVLAAAGYPGSPRTGDPIDGLDAVRPPAYVLHAGTRRDESGRVVSSGGRVLNVVGTGPDLAAARRTAYDGISQNRLDGGQYRRDIAAGAAETRAAGAAAGAADG